MERRYHQPPYPGAPLTIPCRHCAFLNEPDPARVEVTEGRAWQRCASCEEWFLVRWDDAASIGVVKPVDVDVPTD